MKIEFKENEYGCDFVIEPESVEEVNQLFRATNNMKKAPPTMYLTFNDKQTRCYITINKVVKEKQVNSISK